ncbi:MAG: alpha/beta hydrolase [Cyclobacteriaceae bacterium]|nr:MAG: alpha/beta hydrolase [Cyclobacteriaceae bacterium]
MPFILFIVNTSCSVKDRFTFFPDRETVIPASDIPSFATGHLIQTTDGETLQSFYFHHKELLSRQLLIYFHGNAGNLYQRLEPAARLYQMDLDVLLVSYRGYAKSTGTPSEHGIYTDGASAVQYAIDQLGYREEDISILGRSLGSTVAIHTAQHRNFKSVVLVTPLTSGKEMAVAMGLGMLKFLAGDSYNSVEKINNIAAPILIIHGDKDEVVPYTMGKNLYDVFQGKKKMVTIKNGGHNNLTEEDANLYWGEINRFLTAGSI